MNPKTRALHRLVLEALRKGHDVCTRTRMITENGSDYQADIRLRTMQGNIHVFIMHFSPTSHEFNRLARLVRDAYPMRIIIVNLDGGDWEYHLGEMAWSVTRTIDLFWDLVDEFGKTNCPEEDALRRKKKPRRTEK